MKLAWIIFGILLLIITFRAYVRQKMTEEIGMGWLIIAVVIVAVALFAKKEWWSLSMVPWFVLAVAVVLLLFGISEAVSGLIMKNRELAMQVSLLNQENERILHILGILSEESETDESEEKTVVRD
ncbi:MAG: hypothetical protein ACI4AD_05380 [Roseburia sp.]